MKKRMRRKDLLQHVMEQDDLKANHLTKNESVRALCAHAGATFDTSVVGGWEDRPFCSEI